jgi:C4-dicarboxylate transporter, DctM subunit
MNPLIVGIIGIAVLFLFLASGVPVGFSMGLVGIAGFAYLKSMDAGFNLMGVVPFSTATSYDLIVLPLFILMGQFAMYGRLTQNLYRAGHKWLGHLPGGLAMATIGACAGFSAICGSSLATAATMAEVAVPEMRKQNYAPSLALGCVAVGGGLGILIPPSAILVIYGILAQESIGMLFAAGILPGILLAVLYMATIFVQVKLKPALAPTVASASLREKIRALGDTWQVLCIFSVVMGGIWSGVFTATEGAAIGALGCLLFGVIGGGLSREKIILSLAQTVKTTAMIFLIIIGAMLFGYFLSVTRVPSELAAWTSGLGLPRYLVLALIILTFLILGCILDSLAMVLLTMPIFLPLINTLGFDTVWFGIIMVLMVEMGVITPPVGMNVYVVSGIVKDVPLEVIFRGIFPFLASIIVCALLLTVFPQIVLVIPNLLK